MSIYLAPLRDMRFVMTELAGLGELSSLPGFEDVSPELAEAVLDEAAKLATEVLAPLNKSGDEQGARLIEGRRRCCGRFRERLTGSLPKVAGAGSPATRSSAARGCPSCCMRRPSRCGIRRIWRSRCVLC